MNMKPVIHFEIPVDQLDRAKAFYKDLFGWEMSSVPEFNYTSIRTAPSDHSGPKDRGQINGGMLQRHPDLTSPTVTIQVEDIDTLLLDIEKQGGSITVPKRKIGTNGFLAYFKDPEGNVIGLWQPAHPR